MSETESTFTLTDLVEKKMAYEALTYFLRYLTGKEVVSKQDKYTPAQMDALRSVHRASQQNLGIEIDPGEALLVGHFEQISDDLLRRWANPPDDTEFELGFLVRARYALELREKTTKSK